MKRLLASIAIAVYALLLCLMPTRAISPREVEQQKWELDDIIIPSIESTKEEVENVYGTNAVINDKPFRVPTNKPYYIYILLPSENEGGARVALCVVYNEKRVERAWISYSYRICCRPVTKLGTPEHDISIEEDNIEEERELGDLKIIREKYKALLDKAPWNREPHDQSMHKSRFDLERCEEPIPPPAVEYQEP